MNSVLPSLQTTYAEQLEIQFLNLNDINSFQVYQRLHELYPTLPSGIPQLYIDDYVLVGTDEIRENLPNLIDSCLAKGGCDWTFSLESSNITSTPLAANTNPVYLAYFFDPSCLECDAVSYELNYLQAQYPNLVIRRFNIWDETAIIEAMGEHHGIAPENRLVVPTILIGEEYLSLEGITSQNLTSLIEAASVNGNSPPWENLDEAAVELAATNIAERFGNFSILAVFGAGLLDGVNPCAFTTIIFFISYLALVGRGKRDILLVGIAFTLAVFLSYLLMGLGLSAILEQIGSITLISRIIYGGTALFCIALAIVSFVDYLKIRQGRISEIALQLPASMKKRIHQTIRSQSRVRAYVGAAFFTGVLVSVFELACTGQVYLPTIIFMSSLPEMRVSAIAYLVLYNAAFVVPLIVVFAVTYLGLSSQNLTSIFQTNAGLVKLFTALLFTVLGLWLGYLVLI